MEIFPALYHGQLEKDNEKQKIEENRGKDRKEVEGDSEEGKEKWSHRVGKKEGERVRKGWTAVFLGRRNPNWERKCSGGESEIVSFHSPDLKVSLHIGLCPVSRDSPIIWGASTIPKLAWFLPHVPKDTSPMPDTLRLTGLGRHGTVCTRTSIPAESSVILKRRSLTIASDQSSRLGLVSRSESMASWHCWEQ